MRETNSILLVVTALLIFNIADMTLAQEMPIVSEVYQTCASPLALDSFLRLGPRSIGEI